jgi:hypothetical protein
MDKISWINRLHQTELKEKGLNNEVKDINENISRLIAKRKNIFNKLKANESERIYLMSIRPEVMKSLIIIQNKFSEINK